MGRARDQSAMLQRTPTPITTAALASPMSTVNMAARQRMLSQRLALQILLAERGQAGQLEGAEESLALFTASHAKLVESARSAAREEAQKIEDVYGRQRVGEVVQGFAQRCRRALDALRLPAERRGPVDDVYLGLDEVLKALNLATSVFDDISARREQRLMAELKGIVTDIQQVAKQAKIVSFNALVIAARAGDAGREFGVVAGTLSGISGEVDRLAVKGIELVGRR